MNIFKRLFTPRRAWYKARIAELEQRLAALDDALVPAPEGEAVWLSKFRGEHFAIVGATSDLFMAYRNQNATSILTGHVRFFGRDTLVQPVRLVRVRDMEGRNDG